MDNSGKLLKKHETTISNLLNNEKTKQKAVTNEKIEKEVEQQAKIKASDNIANMNRMKTAVEANDPNAFVTGVPNGVPQVASGLLRKTIKKYTKRTVKKLRGGGLKRI